jgi:hypothetical protein
LSGKEVAMARDGPPEPSPYPAEDARGAEIILRRRWQRKVFVAGLIGIVLLAALIALAWAS